MADEQIDQRRILDNRDSEASRFGDHLIAGLAATLADDQRHRRFFTGFLTQDHSAAPAHLSDVTLRSSLAIKIL
jgi:hypothetical protein